MSYFIFSADGHVREPDSLFTNGLPASLREQGIYTKKEGDHALTFAGDKLLHRLRINRAQSSEGERANFGRPNLRGPRDLDARMEDLAKEKIDAEIVFPTMGMFTFLLENRDAEIGSCQLYNDWIHGYFAGHYDRFVRCGVLPIRNFDDTIAEMERLAKLGFTSAMLPSHMPQGVPNYNDPVWDRVFDTAQRLDIVMVLHTATGLPNVRPEKGPGGAIINYTCQMNDAINSIMYMVAGGLLDRFPKAQVAVIESGASWLAGLAERMDEVNHGHAPFVFPKLSVKPSEIIQRQVSISFQYDRGCIMSRSVTGTKGLMWGSDYPHNEGTFPHSQEVIAHLFDGIDISEKEKADILGLNGARLFKVPVPQAA